MENLVRSSSDWPIGEGEMADRIRNHKWASTCLGSIDTWSARLKLLVEQVLISPKISSLVCQPDGILIYNDAAARVFGDRHPAALGQPVQTTFPEGWATVAPFYGRAFAGEAVQLTELPLNTVGRSGPLDVFDALLLPARESSGRVTYVQMIGDEVGAKLRTEAAQRDSGEHRAFLLRLDEMIRPIAEPAAVQNIAMRLLGEYLRVDRCAYGEIDYTMQFVSVYRDYHAADIASVAGRYRIADYGQETAETLRRGEMFVLNDVDVPPQLSGESIQNDYAEMEVRAAVVAPLVKAGRLVTLLTLQQRTPREWCASELQLIQEVADRTWAAVERTRAETAQRESEERFAQFANSSSEALWIRDARSLEMEYASPAFLSVFGATPASVLGDLKRWAALVVPDDRDIALDQLSCVQRKEEVTREYRILRPSDDAFRWIRNTAFPLYGANGEVRRIGGIAQDITEAKQAAEHQTVLLHELQHRVRNTLAMIRSIADRSADRASGVEDYRERLHGRLGALARVQTLLTRAANAGVDLAELVRAELKAQSEHDGQFHIAGPALALSPKAAEVLSLAFHELATNALKYGALAIEAGQVSVSWRIKYAADAPWLALDWVESGSGSLARPHAPGFGTTLIERRIPYELNGSGSLTFGRDGVHCHLEFPLRGGASVLETDAVTLSATIQGGALDMQGEADLNGCEVLVVEDDFYIASDMERALVKAGGLVLGC